MMIYEILIVLLILLNIAYFVVLWITREEKQ